MDDVRAGVPRDVPRPDDPHPARDGRAHDRHVFRGTRGDLRTGRHNRDRYHRGNGDGTDECRERYGVPCPACAIGKGHGKGLPRRRADRPSRGRHRCGRSRDPAGRQQDPRGRHAHRRGAPRQQHGTKRRDGGMPEGTGGQFLRIPGGDYGRCLRRRCDTLSRRCRL